MKVAVIGYGGRGQTYAGILVKLGYSVCAVCDVDVEKLAYAKKTLNLTEENLYSTEEGFFEKGKLADLLMVCTQDQQHLGHAIKALDIGYDLLLEKPIATSVDECNVILEKAKKLNRKIFVCHVLRYAPFFNVIKRELETGKYGKVSTLNITESVGFWHQAHSFVRGNWRNDQISTPMIIAKCCHDLDLISWYLGEKCTAVSSFGSLSHFKKENAPKDSAEYCYDCKYIDSCPYSAKILYVDDFIKKGVSGWPFDIVCTEPTAEKLRSALKNGAYGKCVYKCDNNVVDHQVVNMLFESGATAHLTMTAFSKACYRKIHIHCEKGEIYGSMEDNIIHSNIFGGECTTIDANIEAKDSYGHGGGDQKMMEDIVGFLHGEPSKSLTDIEQSMQSHVIGFNAEKSRINGGKTIQLK